MHRLLFYGIIIVVIFLLLALLDLACYWLLRIFMPKGTAHITNIVLVVSLILTVGISCWYGHNYTRLAIKVTHTEVASPRVPAAFDGFKIAQISDFHVNSFEKEEGRDFIHRLAQTFEEEQPDLIVFTGDLVTLRAAESYPFREALAQLSQIPYRKGEGCIPVYSILGNHDYADYVRDFTPERRNQDVDSLIAVQEEGGWHMLRNSSVLLTRQTSDSTYEHLALVGVENIGEPPFSVYGDLPKALEAIGGTGIVDSTFTILLSHNPTHWRSEVLPQTAIDLTLSGHTHATQFKIGSWSPSKWKYDEWMGLYNSLSQAEHPDQPYVEKQEKVKTPQYLYVNTGLGCVGPAVRVGVVPEVAVITLKAAP